MSGAVDVKDALKRVKGVGAGEEGFIRPVVSSLLLFIWALADLLGCRLWIGLMERLLSGIMSLRFCAWLDRFRPRESNSWIWIDLWLPNLGVYCIIQYQLNS